MKLKVYYTAKKWRKKDNRRKKGPSVSLEDQQQRLNVRATVCGKAMNGFPVSQHLLHIFAEAL
jgi:hypothetical protein